VKGISYKAIILQLFCTLAYMPDRPVLIYYNGAIMIEKLIKCVVCGADAYKEDEGWPYSDECDDRVDSDIYCCSSCDGYLELYQYNGEPVPEQYVSFITDD